MNIPPPIDGELLAMGMKRVNAPELQLPGEQGEQQRGPSTVTKVSRCVALAAAAIVALGAAAKAVAERPVGSGDADIAFNVLHGQSPFHTDSETPSLDGLDAIADGE